MRWWEEPAPGHSFCERVGSGRLAIGRGRLALFLGVCLILLLGVWAQTDFSAPPSPDASVSTPRLQSLPDYCNPFWTSQWGSQFTLQTASGAVVYAPSLHQSVLSSGVANWSVGSVSGAAAPLPPPTPSSSANGQSTQITSGLSDIQAAQKSAFKAQMLSFNESLDYSHYADEWFTNFNNDSLAHLVAYYNTAVPIDLYLRGYDTLTPKGLFGLPIRLKPGINLNDVLHYMPTSLLYTHDWQYVMSNATASLHSAADGANAAFNKTQAEADTLQAMGAGDPNYTGLASQPYQDWLTFVVQSQSWSDPNQHVIDPNNDPSLGAPADEQVYGQAFQTLQGLQTECASPSDIPDFSAGGNLTDTFNLLAADGDNTLWAMAWRRYEILGAARAQMELEKDNNASLSKELRKNLTANLTALRQSGPDNFSYNFSPTDPALALQPSDIVGTLAEQANSADTLAAQGDAEEALALGWDNTNIRANYQQANSNYGPDAPGWASQAIFHYEAASAYYGQALNLAEGVQSQMLEQTQEAQSQASSNITDIQAQLASGLSSSPTGAQAAAQTQARALLKLATADYEKALVAHGLGNEYIGYLKALLELNAAQNALSNNPSSSEGFALNQTLVTYRALLKDGPALNVDVSDYQAGYDDFFSTLVNGSVPDGAAELASSQVDSLRTQLLGGMTDEENRYQTLLSQAQALAPYAPSQANDLTAAFAIYRSTTADGWSDEALSKPTTVRALLTKWETQTNSLISKAMADNICQNAQWTPTVLTTPVAGSNFDAGGEWSSSNTLGLDDNNTLTLDCPFDFPFLPADQTGTSDNVISASIVSKKLHLVLSGITSGQAVMVDYSSSQQPYTLKQTSCLLTVDDMGHMDWKANYSLKADYPAPALEVDIPWPSDSSGPAGLAYAGAIQNGQWSDTAPTDNTSVDSSGLSLSASDSSPQVQFILPSVPSGSSTFSVEIAPDTPTQITVSNQQAVPTVNTTMAVSYQLQMSGLPPCANAQIQRTEGTGGSLDKISAVSSDTTVKPLDTSTPDGRWMLLAHPVPSSGSLFAAIGFDAQDPNDWMSTTLADLQIEALNLNDNNSLNALQQAANLYNSGQSGAAYSLLQTISAQVKSEMADGGQSANDWLDESNAVNQTLSTLSSISASVSNSNSLPPWSAQLDGWQSSLSLAIDSANAQAAAGRFNNSLSTLRKAEAAFNQKALAAAQSDYKALSATLGTDTSKIQPTDSNSNDTSLPDAFANTSIYLSDARSDIQNADIPDTLSALVSAHQSLDSYQSNSLQSDQAVALEQQQEATDLQARASNVSAELQTYADSLTSLSAANSAFKPPLTAAQARTLLTQAVKAAPDPSLLADPSNWTDAAKSAAIVDKQAAALFKANATLAAAQAKSDSALASVQSTADEMLRTATASVAQAHQTVEAAGPPSMANNATLASLDADLQRLNDASDAGQYPDVISLGQSIVTRAKPLLTTPVSSSPPWLLIGATLLLVAGVAYLVMFHKPGEKQPPLEHTGKKLERVESKPPEGHSGKKPEGDEPKLHGGLGIST